MTQELFNSARAAKVVFTAPKYNWQSVLAQSGLLFFLAGHIEREVTAPIGFDAALDPWRKPWTRGSHSQRALFDDDKHVEPTTFRKGEYAAFVNPHLVGPLNGAAGVSNVVQPWLAQFLPPRISANRAFLADVGMIVDELLSNVRHHAALTDDLRALRSLVLVTLARGNDPEVRDRIHITVLDTGMGILVSAHRRMNFRISPSGGALLASIFRGEMIGTSRARGFGLPQIWDRVRSQKNARLYAIANGHSLEGGDTDIRTSSLGVGSLSGTIVTASLSAPALNSVREG
ncbi:MAG: hypothetical protein ABI548_23820 [Polyangiaceae bacterium]